jgi:hypothetical protein
MRVYFADVSASMRKSHPVFVEMADQLDVLVEYAKRRSVEN